MNAGQAIIDAIISSKALQDAIIEDTGVVFIWSANAEEQIEAALDEAGFYLSEKKP